MESIHWASSQPMAEDYQHDFARVRDWFEYNHTDGEAWQERANWLDRDNTLAQSPVLQADRKQVVQALFQFNHRIGNKPEAMEAIEQLKREDSLVIVGGQQAGLFTGSLLAIYKVITLLNSAKEAARRLQRPVIPIFWIAGEDHDLDEVNHTYILSQQQEIKKVKLETECSLRTSISRLPVSENEWETVINQLESELMETEFKAGLLGKLREFAAASRSMTDFFARMLAWLFGDSGLVLLDSDDYALRQLEGPMFRELLTRRTAISGAFMKRQLAITEKGYIPQADVSPDQANLFIYDDNDERILLHWDSGTYTDKKKERSYDAALLADWIESTPERFSNNVFTRPLMQEYLFPVLATVLGPGEIAYWALTGEAFRELGMRMPIVIPRSEYTLIEGTIVKNMDKFSISLDTVRNHFEDWREEWLRAQDELKLEERFAHVRDQFTALYEPLTESLISINPGLGKLGAANTAKILEQIAFLEHKALEANKSRYEASLRQMDRVRVALFPFGKPQERVYNVLAYINRYGVERIRDWVNLPTEPDGLHKIIYL